MKFTSTKSLLLLLSIYLLISGNIAAQPRIVNIVNFIRLLEPRDPAITTDVLYQTVVKQVDLMQHYHLGGTFLLQYDALMDKRYQVLLKSLPADIFEIGGWLEIPQPLVEKAGLKWRGRYPWDWHADVGFTTGYTPAEREKLIDVYMHDFKTIFGYYPKSVACWFIDAHSLYYLYQKYHIVASANCKDQYGTDGYTLWGGYWNQAYYPSIQNAYMPAQHADKQIPVPVFRMLGSDPIRQYDDALQQQRQGVVTLEPVYPKAGGNAAWIDWFFRQFTESPVLGFAYTQAGQENSFTWKSMQKGLELQLPVIKKLQDQGKIKVETLAASGKCFKDKYPVTPSTSIAALEDLPGGTKKTIWYNSRFYRTNLLWDSTSLRFRDIHLFNENLVSAYKDKPVTGNECRYFTLPFVDGYVWSSKTKLAGLVFRAMADGKEVYLKGSQPAIVVSDADRLKISWPLIHSAGIIYIELTEHTISIYTDKLAPSTWFLEFAAADGAQLPFSQINSRTVNAVFEQMHYSVKAAEGQFLKKGDESFVVKPDKNHIVLQF
jgi:hypothetical protein